jgi:hypothetical protein
MIGRCNSVNFFFPLRPQRGVATTKLAGQPD